MNIKTSYYPFFIVVLAFVLSLNRVKVFSIDEVGIFLTVIGLIYGLIAAFTINNSWERFSKIRDNISAETSSLETLYFFGKNLSDKETFGEIKNNISAYLEAVPIVEWKDYWKSEETHKKFRNIMEAFPKISINNTKDAEIFDDIGDELKNAAAARTTQLVLSQTRLTKIQWVLNIFLSLILTISIVFLDINDPYIAAFIVSTMIISIAMILLVIYELDSMKIAEQEVSIEPYLKLAEIIRNDK